jgi:hypothetical protein
MKIKTIVCQKTLAVRKSFALKGGRSVTVVKQIISSKLTHWVASYVDSSSEDAQTVRGGGIKLNEAMRHLRNEIQSAQLENMPSRLYH